MVWAGGLLIGVRLALTSYDIVRGYRVAVGKGLHVAWRGAMRA